MHTIQSTHAGAATGGSLNANRLADFRRHVLGDGLSATEATQLQHVAPIQAAQRELAENLDQLEKALHLLASRTACVRVERPQPAPAQTVGIGAAITADPPTSTHLRELLTCAAQAGRLTHVVRSLTDQLQL